MGIFNWIMKGIGFESEEEEVEDIGEFNERALSKKERKALKKEQKRKKKKYKGGYDDSFNVMTESSFASQPLNPNSFAMNRDQFNTVKPQEYDSMGETGYTQTFNPYGSYNQKNFVFFTPKCYDDIKKLIEYLKQTEPSILNLDNISDDEAQRILDFVSGGVCALNGSIQRIKGNIFLVAPEGFNIKISKDQIQ